MNETATLSEIEGKDLLTALDDGSALPSAWYTDRGIFARERELVVRRGWHYGAHTGQLAEPGDQALASIAGVPVVLVRGDDGEVRGFVNICRHRCHIVVLQPGTRAAMQCQYHGWTYGLDGQLLNAPRADAELDFDPSGLGLVPVQVATWGPTIWINLDRSVAPFAEWIDGLPELAQSRGLEVDAHVLTFEGEWEIAANWKVFLDNAIECYHCPTCHPQLARVLEMKPSLQESIIGGRFWISHTIPFRRSPLGRPSTVPAAESEPERRQYHFHWIFPTTYFQYAGAGFDIGTVDVVDVNRMRFRHLAFLPKDLDPETLAERRRFFETDPTISEDIAICARVQRAHEAGVAPPGRLLPRSEVFVRHFQRVLIEQMIEPAG